MCNIKLNDRKIPELYKNRYKFICTKKKKKTKIIDQMNTFDLSIGTTLYNVDPCINNKY